MSRATEMLHDRSIRYLMDARFLVSPVVGQGDKVNEEAGRVVLAQVNAVLKLALQSGDSETFAELERRWQEIPEETDIWQDAADSSARRLVDYRRILSFGLAMWSAHLLRGRSEPEESAAKRTAADALRLLAGRFEGVEDVFEIYERASERDDEERVPWTNWFLDELPPEEAHTIPTSSELLFTALLLALVWTTGNQPEVVQPRDWMRWREDEVETFLSRLEDEGPHWAMILGLSVSGSENVPAADAESQDWKMRVAHLRELISEGRGKRKEERRDSVRRAALDLGKIVEFEDAVRKAIVERRVIRHLFAAQGSLSGLSQIPQGRIELNSRHWLPKSLLIASSNVVGLDTAARQLARAPLNGEVARLLGVLPEQEPIQVDEAEALPGALGREFERMKETGLQPTLILAPIGWRLRQALGLAPIGSDPKQTANPLVPAVVAQRLDGSFDDVPVFISPQVAARRLWVIDLTRAASFLEWPSDEGSGVRLEVEAFSEAEAQRLVEEKPEIAGDDDPQQATLRVQENALLTQHVCWLIEASDESAARAFELPSSLSLERND